MNGVKTGLLGWCLLGIAALTATGAEIAFVPVDASGAHVINGNEIVLQGGGQRVFIEVYASGWTPEELRAFQVTIDSTGYTSGVNGALAPALQACTTEADCLAAFGGACGGFTSTLGAACTTDADCPDLAPPTFVGTCDGAAKCSYPTGTGGFCEPGFVLSGHMDYLFLTIDDLPAVDLTTLDFRFASASRAGPAADTGTPAYLASFVLDVSPDGMGTFVVDMLPLPGTLLQRADGGFIDPLDMIPALITVVCQTDGDCDDLDDCTDDSCSAGICSNVPNYSDVDDCCNPSGGALTAIDDGLECTDDVCDPSDGSVTHPPLPVATPCGDPGQTECDAPDTCDGFGSCQPNAASPGAPCGDPTVSECNGFDTCDEVGVCQPNYLSASTPCGDPRVSDCTDADTCNGLGECQPNDAADGSLCTDSLFCTEGETCLGGVCGNGTATDCGDGLDCTTDSCNEVAGWCDNDLVVGACLIGGVCRADEELNPGNDCEACLTGLSTDLWSPRPLDSACDDGDACTGTGRPGIGFDVCDGAGTCAGVPDPDCNDDCAFAVPVTEGVNFSNNDNRAADDAEASCQLDSNNDVWFAYTATCDGAVFVSTTGSAFTPSNDPVLSVYDACPGSGGVEIACDDDSGVDLQAALTFSALAAETYVIRVAGFENNTGDIQLNIATVDGCLIADVCVPRDAINPANDCETCIPELSTDSWSPRAEGSSCGNPNDTECDSPDACDGVGVCEVNPKPDGTECSDEGNECTFDVCGSGLCTHPPRPVDTICGDGGDTECDNPDSCDGAALCLANPEVQGAPCGDVTQTQCDDPDICNGEGSCVDNFVLEGTPCNDEDVCTGDDTCAMGTCAGTPIPQAPLVEPFGPRHLRVTPQPLGSVAPVALNLTSPDWTCLDEYVTASGQLSGVATFQLPDDWNGIIVLGSDIVPSSTYEVRAECGAFVSPPGSAMTAIWGDVVGEFDGSVWTPSDGIIDVWDTTAALDRFRGLPTAPPVSQVDLFPCTPDGIIDIVDIVQILDAFRGLPYPCADPCP